MAEKKNATKTTKKTNVAKETAPKKKTTAKKTEKAPVVKAEEKVEEVVLETKKDEEEESMFHKVMNYSLWIILIAWMIICLVDFFRTQNIKKPIFTFAKTETKYEDGKVTCYKGILYKVYFYERDSFNGVEYGPFWIKDASKNK